jgi:hypothetical protein
MEMRKKLKALVATTALMLLVAAVATAEFGSTREFSRGASAGSDGDSTIAAAVTCTPLKLGKHLKDWWVFVGCDSGSTLVYVDVSHDSTTWFQLTTDSLAFADKSWWGADSHYVAGSSRYADHWVRVRTDIRIAAPGAAKTTAQLYQVVYR